MKARFCLTLVSPPDCRPAAVTQTTVRKTTARSVNTTTYSRILAQPTMLKQPFNKFNNGHARRHKGVAGKQGSRTLLPETGASRNLAPLPVASPYMSCMSCGRRNEDGVSRHKNISIRMKSMPMPMVTSLIDHTQTVSCHRQNMHTSSEWTRLQTMFIAIFVVVGRVTNRDDRQTLRWHYYFFVRLATDSPVVPRRECAHSRDTTTGATGP